jgi:hypothetical protein
MRLQYLKFEIFKELSYKKLKILSRVGQLEKNHIRLTCHYHLRAPDNFKVKKLIKVTKVGEKGAHTLMKNRYLRFPC